MSESKSSRAPFRTYTHWGAYDVEVNDGRIGAVTPFFGDPDPSPIGASFTDSIDHRSRVRRPAVRKGWLERGPDDHGGNRGDDSFIEMSWDEATELAADELRRVSKEHGNSAIFGGSYGWASAGRFHRAQSQLHRFLNLLGGYTASVGNYSFAAADVIVPHVLGSPFFDVRDASTTWPVIATNCELVISFGGIPLKNAQVNNGGVGRHLTRGWLEACRDKGVEFVNVSPLRADVDDLLGATWLAVWPNTDTALMLGLAHTLFEEGLHDEEFLGRYSTGFDRFLPYLTGGTDGQPKDAEWAAAICGIEAATIVGLARRMARHRTLITVAWSLQRADHGEQPYWMATALAAMLGQIGLPGTGIGFGYGATSATGNPVRPLSGPTLPQGANLIDSFIPVARIADMLLYPGCPFEYDGQQHTYPDIRLVYWCGGNPFHHHQDLNRLARAWQRPDTVIVNEPWWNANARHADIVFPAATPLERNDIGRAGNDDWVFPMNRAVEPIGEARPDFEIFAGIARELGFESSFTEDLDEAGWLRRLYGGLQRQARAENVDLSDFADFWRAGGEQMELADQERVLFAEFRRDPEGFPLGTPTGRIEIFSDTIDSFGYDDCPGHPVWLEPAEWLGSDSQECPLHLVSNQPTTRLHSQYDCGSVSQAAKVGGREPVTLNPGDAHDRGISPRDVVRLFNRRGECLAGAVVSDDVMPGVVVLATGAWYDPVTPGGLDRHGNANVLTLDKGTSRLAQGPSSHTTMVEAEKFHGAPPAVGAFEPPSIERGPAG